MIRVTRKPSPLIDLRKTHREGKSIKLRCISMRTSENDMNCPIERIDASDDSTYPSRCEAPPKVVLLFGAGASRGCGGLGQNEPPTSRQLYGVLREKFPDSWGRLSNTLHHSFESKFEDGMERMYQTNRDIFDYLKDLTVLMSTYRIDKVEDNLYYALIRKYADKLVNEEVVFATLNYDCLIELAALAGNPNISISYWGRNQGLRLLKIHGSCNFLPAGISGQGKYLIEPGAKIDCSITLVDPLEVRDRMATMPVPAAMSLYTRSKVTIIGERTMNWIKTEFQKGVRSARLVAIVGIQPPPPDEMVDEHIWASLRRTGAKLLFVGNEEKCKRWIAGNRLDRGDIWVSDSFQTGSKVLCRYIDELLSRVDSWKGRRLGSGFNCR